MIHAYRFPTNCAAQSSTQTPNSRAGPSGIGIRGQFADPPARASSKARRSRRHTSQDGETNLTKRLGRPSGPSPSPGRRCAMPGTDSGLSGSTAHEPSGRRRRCRQSIFRGSCEVALQPHRLRRADCRARPTESASSPSEGGPRPAGSAGMPRAAMLAASRANRAWWRIVFMGQPLCRRWKGRQRRVGAGGRWKSHGARQGPPWKPRWRAQSRRRRRIP